MREFSDAGCKQSFATQRFQWPILTQPLPGHLFGATGCRVPQHWLQTRSYRVQSLQWFDIVYTSVFPHQPSRDSYLRLTFETSAGAIPWGAFERCDLIPQVGKWPKKLARPLFSTSRGPESSWPTDLKRSRPRGHRSFSWGPGACIGARQLRSGEKPGAPKLPRESLERVLKVFLVGSDFASIA